MGVLVLSKAVECRPAEVVEAFVGPSLSRIGEAMVQDP